MRHDHGDGKIHRFDSNRQDCNDCLFKRSEDDCEYEDGDMIWVFGVIVRQVAGLLEVTLEDGRVITVDRATAHYSPMSDDPA